MSVEPMPCRHVIWDWNGTLLNDVWLCVEVVNEMLRDYQLPGIDTDCYRRDFCFPVVNYYQRLGFNLDGDNFHHLSVDYIGRYDSRRQECGLHPGTLDTLEAIRRAGIRQSILSAYKQDTLESIVQLFGIQGYFDHVCGQNNIYAAGKAERGKELMQALGLPGDEVVMVGDTEHDYEVAVEMGSRCILVEHGHHTSERLGRLGVPIARDLSAVADLLIRDVP